SYSHTVYVFLVFMYSVSIANNHSVACIYTKYQVIDQMLFLAVLFYIWIGIVLCAVHIGMDPVCSCAHPVGICAILCMPANNRSFIFPHRESIPFMAQRISPAGIIDR